MSTHVWILKSCGLLAALLPFALLDFVKRTVISDILSSSILISLVVTTCALLISTAIPVAPLDSAWCDSVGDAIVPARPLLLNGINWIFDFATVLVTVLLLSYVRKYGRFIAFTAILDIGISGILTLLLFHSLRLLSGEPAQETALLTGFDNAAEWFMLAARSFLDIIHGTPPPSPPLVQDLHLLPVLLTTFVPTAMYMSVFIVLSSVKLIIVATCRVLEVVGERNESVFQQFGVLIATLMAAVKTIYDYLVAT